MNTLALCIPAYQAANHLPRLLSSAQRQLISFDEVWVYDDASLDDTSKVARKFGAFVVRGLENIGCSAGKNELMLRTNCDWVHFHDSDDELLPNFTTLAHGWMKISDCPDVVLFDYEYRDNCTKRLISASDFNSHELEDDPLRYAILHQINPFCGLYRRSSLLKVGGYDVDPLILYNEDVAFHIKLALSGLSFSAEKELSIVNYRMPGSMSGSNQLKCLLAHVEVMRRVSIKTGERYSREIKFKLWGAAQGLASMKEWAHVDQALQIASGLSPALPSGVSPLFALVVRIFGASIAFRVREYGIRLFKPHLRKS